jgi:hypothetical protein
LRAFRSGLEAEGKKFKQVIVAVARKLLTVLNAMPRTGNCPTKGAHSTVMHLGGTL